MYRSNGICGYCGGHCFVSAVWIETGIGNQLHIMVEEQCHVCDRLDVTDYPLSDQSDNQTAAGDSSQARTLCMLLDFPARNDLRDAVNRGYINRSYTKQRGVKLLKGLGLIEQVKKMRGLSRYEPTALGREVAKYLPTLDSDTAHILLNHDLVYGDGTICPRSEVPKYSFVRDYVHVIRQVEHGIKSTD